MGKRGAELLRALTGSFKTDANQLAGSFKMNANQRRRFRELVLEGLDSTEKEMAARSLEFANALEEQRRLDPTDMETLEMMHTVMTTYMCVSEQNFEAFNRDSLTDEQFEIYYDLKKHFLATYNMYFVIKALVWSVQECLTPPAWILLSLAQGFSKHLESPNIELLPRQLGLQAVGSGKTSPHNSFVRELRMRPLLIEMVSILSSYNVSKTIAAKAAILKHESHLKPKTLVNAFNENSVMRTVSGKVGPIQDEKTRSNYYLSFPAEAKRLLRKPRP